MFTLVLITWNKIMFKALVTIEKDSCILNFKIQSDLWTSEIPAVGISHSISRKSTKHNHDSLKLWLCLQWNDYTFGLHHSVHHLSPKWKLIICTAWSAHMRFIRVSFRTGNVWSVTSRGAVGRSVPSPWQSKPSRHKLAETVSEQHRSEVEGGEEKWMTGLAIPMLDT